MQSFLKIHSTFFALIIFTFTACKKNDDPAAFATLTIKSITPTSGAVGAKVVIEGTAFSSVITENVVKFGGVVATLDSASATRLVTKVPNGAVTGKITITIGLKEASSVSDFTVIVNPPVFDNNASANVSSGITRTSATVASTLTGKGGQPITQYGHVWSKSNNPPTLADSKSELGALPATAAFPFKMTSSLASLEGNRTYYVRAYSTAGGVTTYGPVFEIKTKNLPSAWGNVKVLADFPGVQRSDSKLFTINSKLYVFGGRRQTESSATCTNELWQYNPVDNKWIAQKSIPLACNWNLHKDTPLLIFGNEALFLVEDPQTYATTAYSYNTTNDSWTIKKKTPFTRNGKSAFAIGNKGFVVARGNSSQVSNDVWEYDFTLDTWTKKSNFPGTSRNGAFAITCNGKGYIMGGINASSEAVQEVWEYNIASDQWSQKKSAPPGYNKYTTFFDHNYYINGNSLIFFEFIGLDPVYNFVTDIWSEQKQPADLTGNQYDFNCNYNASLYYDLIKIDNKLYLFFNDDPGKCSSLDNQLWEYKL